jgi:predicted transcriptional regulator
MTTASDKPIGDRIREEREALGLSKEGLAYLAGVSHKTIERIEAGKSIPRRATLTVIEAALAETEEAAA